MADHDKPSGSSRYDTEFFPELHGRIDDALFHLDPAYATPTNLPVGAKRWSSAGNKWETWNGTAWGDMAATYGISISGNAATVTTNANLTGDVTSVGNATTLPAATIASKIHAATDKAAPVDADELGMADSAASFGLKKLTFANLWTWAAGKIAAAFGLGATATPVLTDWATLPPSGFYRTTAGTTGTDPEGGSGARWTVLAHCEANTSNGYLLAVKRDGAAATDDELYWNRVVGGAWQGWRKTYDGAATLTALLTVDGAGSTLDADLLDGQEGAYYAPVDAGVYGRGLSLLCRTTGAVVGAGGTTAGTNLEHLGISSGTTNTWAAITAGTWKNVTDKVAGANSATYFQRIS